MNDGPIENRLCNNARPTRGERVDSLERPTRRARDGVMVSDQVYEVAVESICSRRHATAQLHYALDDGVEHWLKVGWRAGNGTQDFTGCGLLFQRFSHLTMSLGQSAILLLQLREQAHVLDRDDGLIGEGLKQGDLSVRKELGLGTTEVDRTDRDAFSHQGHAEVCMNAFSPRECSTHREFLCFRFQVSNMNRPPVEHCATIDRFSDQRDGARDGDRAVMRGEQQTITFPTEDGGVEGLAQASCALRYGIEHWLDVSRRARDDAQDLARRRLALQRVFRLVEEADVLDGDDGLVGEGGH